MTRSEPRTITRGESLHRKKSLFDVAKDYASTVKDKINETYGLPVNSLLLSENRDAKLIRHGNDAKGEDKPRYLPRHGANAILKRHLRHWSKDSPSDLQPLLSIDEAMPNMPTQDSTSSYSPTSHRARSLRQDASDNEDRAEKAFSFATSSSLDQFKCHLPEGPFEHPINSLIVHPNNSTNSSFTAEFSDLNTHQYSSSDINRTIDHLLAQENWPSMGIRCTTCTHSIRATEQRGPSCGDGNKTNGDKKRKFKYQGGQHTKDQDQQAQFPIPCTCCFCNPNENENTYKDEKSACPKEVDFDSDEHFESVMTKLTCWRTTNSILRSNYYRAALRINNEDPF